jgi:hypothetical protein
MAPSVLKQLNNVLEISGFTVFLQPVFGDRQKNLKINL